MPRPRLYKAVASKAHCKNGHEYTEENTYRNPTSTGISIRCRQCIRDREDRMLDEEYEKYEAKLEYRRQYQRTHKHKITARIQATIDFVRASKDKCVYCNESHPACLDFHHRDPQDKIFSLSKSHIGNRSMETVKAEMAKCDVVCANCHRKIEQSFKEID